jgi:hypothetical protein
MIVEILINSFRKLVTDLQGIEYEENGQKEFILTDPVIHCLNQQFGCTDLGKAAIECFFKSHVCSTFCDLLALKKDPMQPKDEIPLLTLRKFTNRLPLFKDYNYELLC